MGTLKQRVANKGTLNTKLNSRYFLSFYEVSEEEITVYL